MLLNRPHKGVYYGTKCNYRCSYCLADPDRERLGDDSFDVDAAIRLLAMSSPSVVSVSGGETGIWKPLSRLLDGLEHHVFFLCTNLSLTPETFFHQRVKMLLATFHPEMTTEDAFFDNAKRVVDRGQKVFTKIIVQPGAERRNVGLWERLNEYGAPAAFVPMEIYGGNTIPEFDPKFLHDAATRYLTSTILNGRFFRTFPKYKIPSCSAGTADSFMIGPRGDIRRCAIEQRPPAASLGSDGNLHPSSLEHPAFFAEPQPCSTSSGNCMCEYHHWGNMAPGNDNALWEGYLKTGTWNRPTGDDLRAFLKDMHWGVKLLDDVL